MELNKINWFQVTDIEDVNKAWALFHNLFIKVLNRVAPIKQVRLKQRSEPCMDGHILDLINQRDQALHNFRKSKIADDFKHLSKLRNKVQYSIRKAKRHFYNNKIEDHKNSSSDLWKTLKSLGTLSKMKSGSTSIGLDVDGSTTFDKLKVADTFNAFFTTVANKLVSKLPTAVNIFNSKCIHQYYKQKEVVQNAFSFSLLSETEVCKMLKGLSPRKATGLDDLPARFICDGAEGIAYPISYIINLSLKTGVVPDKMKTAIPLYKKNSKLEPGNYRPVSILSTLSKISERAVHIQLEIYLKENNLFYKFQSGFRTSFSTDTCLTYLKDYIWHGMDNGLYTGMVMIDLQKAFDTVNHFLLSDKLQALGLNNVSVSWLDSYLTSRTQKVDITHTFSKPRMVPCGVPQGSILGPLLFLIYVNDMESAVKCKLLLYADDSALLVSGKDIKVIQETLGKELCALSSWLVDNKLFLHLGKTESILFESYKKICNSPSLDIKCGDTKISSKKSVRYLGLDLEQTLSGKLILENILKKGNSRLKFLKRQAKYLNLASKRLLSSALIQCHMDYACSSWYHGLQKNLKHKLQILQNKTIRFVLDLTPRSHIGYSEFNWVNWLPVRLRVQQIVSTNMHRLTHGNAPL